MNFDGFLPFEISRWSSLVEQDTPDNLPVGVCPLARNVRFHLTGARTRDGIQNQYGFKLPDADANAAVTGLAALKVGGPTGDLQVPVAFSALGNLYIESPPGSGRVQLLNPTFGTLPADSSLQIAPAFGKGFYAPTDLKQSTGFPLVHNPALRTLDPCSMKQAGQPWSPATDYVVGEVVTPSTPVTGNSHSYRCTVAGTSGPAQPVFPTTEGGTVADGTVTWKETTPLMAQALPEAPITNISQNNVGPNFAAGRDLYIIITLVNGVGETDAQLAFQASVINTSGTVHYLVHPSIADLPVWVQNLAAPYKPTAYNVYEADVPTGNPPPAISAFLLLNGAPVALGGVTVIDTAAVGAPAPTTNSALIVPLGNICSGLRYMVVLFINRNGYISGMSPAYVVSYNGPSDGFQLYTAYLPIGPANTVARLVCFTPAGQLNQLAGSGISPAGPYFWIDPAQQYFVRQDGGFSLSNVPGGVTVAEIVNGVTETSTLINDNTTTTATFNFDDNYLKSFTANDVSAFFNKMQVPRCSDVWYSNTLQRMFYADDDLPSGWRISLAADPESVYSNTGLIQVAEQNGENRTAVREFSGVVYLMKEKSGHVLNPAGDDPSQWRATQQWSGSGPCGPRAVDTCSTFMCYVHRSGVWIFKSDKPFLISKELPITWSGINWAAQQTIWVLIDDETREIRIGLPYGKDVTVPNLVLKCNYEESPDFDSPIHFSPYVGKEIATGNAYKWSIDDIAANCAIRAERTLGMQLPPTFDLPTQQSQILYASSNSDGAVAAVVPFIFDDNGSGIDSAIESSCPEITDGKYQGTSLFSPSSLGGVMANIDGYGLIAIEVLGLRVKHQKQGGPPLAGQSKATAGDVYRMSKDCVAGVPYSCGGQMTNERMRLRISNNKTAGAWFDVKKAWIFAKPITTARPR